MSNPETPCLNIGYLYPDEMNLYGDRGNVQTLVRRCQWRDINVKVTTLDIGADIDPNAYDLFFMGGGQDAQQIKVCKDLITIKKDALKQAHQNGAVFLGICGGYQMFGHYYKPHDGDKLEGIGIIDIYTLAGDTRFIGNVTIERNNKTLVGFENHSGKTYLGNGVNALGKVLTGKGNNGEDGYEGVAEGNVYGTYLHGPLLPKNPVFADELIKKALKRRHPDFELISIKDDLEDRAHIKAKSLSA